MHSNPIITLTCLVVLLASSFFESACFAQQEMESPNIIFLLTDDQRWDAMGCAGNTIIQTPEMDQLAQSGIRFSHSFVTTPICAASRASFLTGTYERQHGYTFQQPPIAQELIEDAYPTLLRKEGYRTGFVGKFGVKVTKNSQSKMFDVFHPTSLPYLKKDGRHLTEINTEHAIEFIRSHAAKQPFCLTLSYWAPHAEDSNPDQYVWDPGLDEMYKNDSIPAPQLSSPEFFQSLPDFQKQTFNRKRWGWRFDTEEKYQRMVKGYYRMIQGVDQSIGHIRAELERQGLSQNTVIILAGDNGYFLGERGFAGKWTMHDVSLRVPLIIHDPQLDAARKGTVSNELTINLDVPATLLGYANIQQPKHYRGKDLRNIDQPEREFVFTEHLWNHESIPRTEAIRTQKWKYIRYPDQPEFEELYNLEKDPNEQFNLWKSADHQEVIATMRKKCDDQIESLIRPSEK